MAKQMKIQYAENYSKGGVTFSEWSKDDFFQEQFKEWMEDGNVHKFEDGYSTQDAQWRNRLKNMSDLKRYFYKEFIKGQYNSYAGGGKAVKKYVVTGNVVDGDEIFKETFDNLDEAIELATEIQNGWSDDGTLYSITIYDEKGKKISTIYDDKYFNELTEHKFFKKVELGAETKKERQVENEKLKGYKFNLQVRIASYPDNLTIFDKTFDSIFDVMDEMNNYYEEDYYAYINNEDLEYWEDKYYEIDEKRNYIKGKYGWSFFKEGDLWIAKDDFEDKHIVRFVDGKPKSNSSITKGALKQIIELENSNKYADGGSTDDKHLIAKAIEYITGYAVDTDSIVKKGFTYNFTYKGRNVSSSLDSKLIDDTIRMNKKSMASRYAESSATKYVEGGGVKVDGLTKQDFIDAYLKRVDNVIENLTQKGEYDSEDFDLLGEVDKEGGFTEIEEIGWWLNYSDGNIPLALAELMAITDYIDEGWDDYRKKSLEKLFFGKNIDVKFELSTAGDFELGLVEELEKIKLLSKKVDFDEVRGTIDYEEAMDNTNLMFYKNGERVMFLAGIWTENDELETIIEVDDNKIELNYHPLASLGGLDLEQLKENIDVAFKDLNIYSAVVSIEGYEEYAEDVEGLENARATIQNIKGNTRFQVLKGSSVGIGKRVDDSRVIEEFKKGGEAGFDDAGTSLAMYHETTGNWLVPKGQVYLWLYDVENSAEKIESGEFDYVQYPLTSMSMAWQRGYIPPLKRIWTKKFQKMNKGSEHLLGVIKAFLINENGKEELYIDMMSVNPTKKKKGIMSYMIKDLRDTFNLSQDQITFSKLTPEGEKFVAKKQYDDGGETSGLITDEQVKDLSFKIKIKNVPLKKGVLLHQIVTLEEFDLPDEENINFYPFHLIYGDSSLAIFDAFGVDEVAGLKRKDCEGFINNLKAQGKTEKDGSFIAGLTNYVGDKLFMFFNVERLSYEGFANRVLPHEALHLSRSLISLFKNDWVRENLNTPNWWEDKRAVFVDMGDSNEEFFAETLERTTAIAMDGWFKVTGQKCIVDKSKKYSDGGGVEEYINIDKMNPDKYEVVRNFNTLKSLAKMGFIELDEKTGLRYKNYEDKMRGNRVTNVRHDYIKSAISPYFENNNKKYAIGYEKGLNFLKLYVLEDITN